MMPECVLSRPPRRIFDKRPPQASLTAFTIVELLMSMAIIFVLITAVAVALKGAKKSADRTRTLNALKQMVAGYNHYTGENDGRLLPGYLDSNMLGIGPNQLDIKAKLSNGTQLTTESSASYVWRLAPYLDYAWQTYMTDYRSSDLATTFSKEFDAGIYGPGEAVAGTLGISRAPSIGLNSIFLGGDNVHLTSDLVHWKVINGVAAVNPDTVAVSRAAHVLSPARIIVFAPTQAAGFPAGIANSGPVALGYAELRPPFWLYNPAISAGAPSTQQWMMDGSPATSTYGQAIKTPGALSPAGLPVDRISDDKIAKVPIGHLDGSVEIETLDRLSVDMSRWAPTALRVEKEWK